MHHDRSFVSLGTVVAVVVLTLAFAATASAQTRPGTGTGTGTGGKVFGLVGGSFGDGGTAVVTSGGAGVRLTRHLGLDLEVLHVSGLYLSEDDFFILPLTFAPSIEREGGLTAFLTKLNVDFPVGDRLIPFVAGGGGVAQLSEEISFDVFDIDDRNDVTDIRQQVGRQFVSGRPLIFPPDDITRSETGLALTLEGGLDLRLWKGFSLGGGARWLRLLSDRGTFDFAQITSRVSYRF